MSHPDISDVSQRIILGLLEEASVDAGRAFSDAKSLLARIVDALPRARSRAEEMRIEHAGASAKVRLAAARVAEVKSALAQFRVAIGRPPSEGGAVGAQTSRADLAGMSVPDLRRFSRDRGIGIKFLRERTKDELVRILAEELGSP